MPTPFGKYVLLRKLGEGGMAEVYLARRKDEVEGSKPVVIKRMLRELCDRVEFVKMFANEARLAVRLRHPNIARTLDLGEHHGDLFIAMEFVNGEDLAHVARAADKRRMAPLQHGTIVRIMIDVCRALHHAHQVKDATGNPLGIVHRDVSPQNVLLTYDGQVKIIDFGVAKATALVGETQAGVMKGKYAYMSPEQCKGEKIDARADVFSVGVVCWELFAWKRLFKREADYLTLAAVVGDPVPSIHKSRREVPPELDELLGRALSKSRDQRFASCDVLAAELEKLGEKSGWDTSPHTLATTMHMLFAEKIEAQRRTVEEANAKNLDDFLLKIDEATKITWMRTAEGSSPAQDPRANEPTKAPSQSTPRPQPDLYTPPPIRRAAAPPAPGDARSASGPGSRPDPPAPSVPSPAAKPAGKAPVKEPTAPAPKAIDLEKPFAAEEPTPSSRLAALAAATAAGAPRPAAPSPEPAAKTAPAKDPLIAAFEPSPPGEDFADIDHLSSKLPAAPPPKQRSFAILGGAAVVIAALAIGFVFLRSRANGETAQAEATSAPEAAPPKPAAPPDPAHVVLRGQPDVKVFVNGRRRGETPTVLEDLRPGRRYVILLVADGFKDGKVEVAPLSPGEERQIDVKLEP